MPRVGHHHRGGAGKRGCSESCRAVGTEVCCHAGPCRAAPDGVARRVDLQLCGMTEDAPNTCRQIFEGRLRAARLVLDDECIVAFPAQRQGVGKALVDGADVREAASGTDDRKRRARPSAKEEQPGVLAPEVVEYFSPGHHRVDHLVDVAHAALRVNIIMVGEQPLHVRERHVCVVSPFQRQDVVAKPLEGGMRQNVGDGAAGGEVLRSRSDGVVPILRGNAGRSRMLVATAER